MTLVKNKSTPENREFWAHVEKVAAEVRGERNSGVVKQFQDWRLRENFDPTADSYHGKPCDVCGSTWRTGSEPRFGYVVCEDHFKLPPAEVSRISRDPLAAAAREIREKSGESEGVYTVDFDWVYDRIKRAVFEKFAGPNPCADLPVETCGKKFAHHTCVLPKGHGGWHMNKRYTSGS